MPGLWKTQHEDRLKQAEPLAARMRPKTLDEFAGQTHILGEGKLLRRMIEADRLTSLLFYGPPGTGKTTLAELIARHTERRFERANAAAVGVKEVRFVLDEARRRLTQDNIKTIFFLDEVHRFNKAQQDVLLGDVERGVITFVGATTENPFFAVNKALVSRSQVFQFEPVSEEEIVRTLKHAISDTPRGYGEFNVQADEDALRHWATICDGDVRKALSALEIAVESQRATGDKDAVIVIDLPTAEDSIQTKQVAYDATGDEHYDTISAFIKSMRGSDPDAAVYWLARMLTAGEDPLYIARRIAILASEDIGNADPQAIQVAASAYELTHRIGMPECQLTLGQAAIYMATAPKSNASAQAIWTAMSDAKNQRTQPVPKHLRDGHYAGAKQLGHTGYKNPHKNEAAAADQIYLGVDKAYYVPTNRGHEERIGRFMQWLKDGQAGNKDGA